MKYNIKDILLYVANNYDKISSSEKMDADEIIRKNFNNIIHSNRPKTEREKEIDRLAKNEFEEYVRKKEAFNDNPVHWDNNKRRRHKLPTLRWKLNKNRLKKYPAFYPSVRFYCMMEDLMNEIFTGVMWDEFFNSFVDVKDLANNDVDR
jgi:hypothetical protein